MSIVEKIVELIRETSSSLPDDVEKAIRSAWRKEEKGGSAAVILKTILDNCALARKQGTPLCQDTGTLTFFVDANLRRKVTPAVLKKAVAKATELGYLRKNCIDSVTGKSYDDNCAEGAPVVHYVATDGTSGGPAPLPKGGVTLMMKGGGSENMSRQYSLPDATLGAGRDLAGVRKCILDAVQKTQGYGCAPGILGVCIGGDRATGYEVAKEQLLRPLNEKPPASSSLQTAPSLGSATSLGDATSLQTATSLGSATSLQTATSLGDATPSSRQLVRLERQLLREANTLGIGPMGLGGKTTLLGLKLATRPRVPASFFVTVAYMCWAARRRTVVIV